jgi:glycosyltransferase involved in cell wall biosynthesis
MGAPSARTFELSRQWVKRGASVTVITGFPNHPTGVIPEAYKGLRFLREEKDGISILRTYVYATPNEGFFKRIISFLSFMFSSIVQGTSKSGDQDVIIATSPQFFVGVAGYVISRLKKIPFIFEVRDLWPESIKQLGILKNPIIIKILEFIEMFLYKKSLHVIGVADSTVEILSSRGVPAEKISIIKNGVDLELFNNKINGEKIRISLNASDKFIISYIGTHGLSHALEHVLEAASLLKDRTDMLFLLIGEGAEKNKLVRMAKELKLTNVKFVDQISKEDLPYYYAACDAILVTLKNLPLFKCVIPSKIFEIMAMSRPILISVEGESQILVVDKAHAGLKIKPEDPLSLKKGIEEIYNKKDLCREFGQNGRKFVETYFDRNVLANSYFDLITQLLKSTDSV